MTNATRRLWLAADYHLPATYSCRLPFSSATSAQVSPGPGPASVRLALIRTGVELFGREHVRDTLFPVVRTVPVFIRPPVSVALSPHFLHGYKVDAQQEGYPLRESLLSREMAHAQGELTIYLNIAASEEARWTQLLMTIGYWGQTNSFATCLRVRQEAPQPQECVMPLQRISSIPLHSFFSCILSEFRDSSVAWEEIDPFAPLERANPFKLDIYVWPLRVVTQHGGGQFHTAAYAIARGRSGSHKQRERRITMERLIEGR